MLLHLQNAFTLLSLNDTHLFKAVLVAKDQLLIYRCEEIWSC